MKNILIITIFTVKIILALSWFYLGFNTLYPIEIAETTFYAIFPIHWFLTPIMIRIFIGLIFSTTLLIVFPINKSWLKYWVFILCLIAWADILFLQNTSYYSGLFKFPEPLHHILYMVLISVLTLIYIFFQDNLSNYLNKYKIPFWLKIIWIIGIILLFLLPFILNPVYPQDFSQNSSKDDILLQQTDTLLSHFPVLNNSNEPTLVAFFSTGCGFCKISAIRLQQIVNHHPQALKIHIVYWGTEEYIKKFRNATHNDLPYFYLENEKFPEMAGFSYPHFKLIKNGKLLHAWTGSQFNYHAYQSITKYDSK